MVSTVEEQPFPPGSEQRIADFAELVALALANAEAREELAASRARIVEAGDAERRRLERNLHDGAQQRLVALALTLRLSRGQAGRAATPRRPRCCARANAELADALEELRELARGIHPSILTDRGLVPALEMLADRASIPVELAATLDERLPDAGRGRRLLHRRRGAHERLQARPGVARSRAREPRRRQRAGRGGRRRRRRRRPRSAAPACAASATASRRSAARSSSSSPSGVGTTLSARIPCE